MPSSSLSTLQAYHLRNTGNHRAASSLAVETSTPSSIINVLALSIRDCADGPAVLVHADSRRHCFGSWNTVQHHGAQRGKAELIYVAGSKPKVGNNFPTC